MQLLSANASQHLSGSVLSSQPSHDELFCRASELEPHSSAALQLNCTYAGTGFWGSRNNMRNTSHNELNSSLLREHIPRAEAETALKALGVPYEAAYVSSPALLAKPAVAQCGVLDIIVQWRGIAASFKLMQDFELRERRRQPCLG